MKQKLEWYYIVWNTKEDRPEHSNGQSGKYYNMYKTINPAKTLRTKRQNFLKEKFEPDTYREWLNREIEIAKDNIAYYKTEEAINERMEWKTREEVLELFKKWSKMYEDDIIKHKEELKKTDEQLLKSPNIFEVWRINIAKGIKELCIDVNGNIIKDGK